MTVEFLMFYQIFLPRQKKQSAIASNKHDIWNKSQVAERLKALHLRIFGKTTKISKVVIVMN